ncbi:MAG: transposase [Pseudomonadota bacterium]
MKRKRRTHSAEFKARVAAEALKGIKPIHEIAAENPVSNAELDARESADEVTHV